MNVNIEKTQFFHNIMKIIFFLNVTFMLWRSFVISLLQDLSGLITTLTYILEDNFTIKLVMHRKLLSSSDLWSPKYIFFSQIVEIEKKNTIIYNKGKTKSFPDQYVIPKLKAIYDHELQILFSSAFLALFTC